MKQRLIFLFLTITYLMVNSCDEAQEEEQVDTSYSFLIGAYTENETQGIGLLSFDPEKNLLQSKIIAPGLNNPSFVIANKAQTMVFAVEETGGENGGKVVSLKLDRQTNTMEKIDSQSTLGDHPCYLSLDPKEEFLVVGNYSGGNFSAYKINNGNLELVQTYQHEGQSINPDRQGSPHVHSVVFHPNGKQLLVGDLGTDKIHIYDFNPNFAVPFNNGTPPYFEADAGVGPRHLIVHPSGSPIYLVHELTAEIGVYSYNAGSLSKIQTVPLTDEEFVGGISAAEVRLSPNARFLYASNRGDANEISVFEVEKDGRLTFVERVKSGGEMPRNFIITKDGKYLLAAHQASNNITVFERNQKTGKLTKLNIEGSYPKPVYFFGLD
ncbi:lactonase family protein [Shivajiella indica]|uniref:Lactonase family protein n=1 Tax=Shivajiella indica TaxID=872115 RepID=A0ABW5B4C1_9BACT